MNSVEWNPKYNLLAYAGDDKSAKYYGDEGTPATFCVSSNTNSFKVAVENELTRNYLGVFAGVFRIFGFDSS